MAPPTYDPTPLFLSLLKRFGIPDPVRELRFARPYDPPRQWRFDFAWEASRVALEVEGGLFTRGRHVRGAGALEDMNKYNAAALHGWKVLRTTPDHLTDIGTVRMVGEALGVKVGEIGTL